MRKNLTFLFLLIFTTLANAQDNSVAFEQFKAYTANIQFYGKLYDTQSDQCLENKNYSICANTRFEVVSINGDVVKIKIVKGYVCASKDNLAIEGKNFYCIKKSDILYVKQSDIKLGLDFGALAVPFKFQSSSFKVYPGGNISGYIGLSIKSPRNKDFYVSTIGFAGFSLIPLSDLGTTKSTDIKTVTGFTTGLGVVCNLKGGFQLGVVKGWDFFNVDDTKQSQGWLSIAFGYQFLKKSD